MKHGSTKRWSRTSAAYLGALLGIAVAMAHHVHHALVGEFPTGNPLAHIALEMITYSACGALILTIVTGARNRVSRTKSSADRSVPNSGR
jgi:hypothetical protein